MTLCQMCENLVERLLGGRNEGLDSLPQRYKHHTSLSNLEESAKNGCSACDFFRLVLKRDPRSALLMVGHDSYLELSQTSKYLSDLHPPDPTSVFASKEKHRFTSIHYGSEKTRVISYDLENSGKQLGFR